MSDAAERAEKAARAKALLKKRQQQKTSGGIADGGGSPRTSSPTSALPPAPAPSTPPPNFGNQLSSNATDIQDASVLFGKTSQDADFGEFGVLASPSPLRPIPSPMALGREISSPSPLHFYNNRPHSPFSPVLSKLDRRTSTPIGSPNIQKGPSPNEVELQTIRSKHEAEIAQLNAELKTVRSVAANEAETLRNELERALLQAEDSNVTSQSKIQELETSLSQAKKEHEASLFQTQEELAKLRSSSTSQQQTITLLVNEKTALVDEVSELNSLRTKLSESEEHISQVRTQAANLQEKLSILETERSNRAAEIKDLVSKLQTSEQNEQSLHEQTRALDVDLKDGQRALVEIQRKLEERENELRVMKEDDRVEVLERALSASRERLEELGESMGRLQENLATATRNGDDLAAQLDALTAEKTEYLQKHSILEASSKATNEELERLRQQRQSISEERARLQADLNASRESIASQQQQLSTLSANLNHKTRHHDELESILSATSRKLADTEASIQALRSENTKLLAQLEEVRPKLVELTNRVAEDEDRISSRDRKVNGLEREIVSLETELHDLRLQLDNADKRCRQEEENGLRIQAEKEEAEQEITQSKKVHDELEATIAKLREELGKSKEENQAADKMSSQLAQERDMLRSDIRSLEIELDRVRYASEELQKSEADSNEVLEGMRTELESLREQLLEKDQEMSNLRSSSAANTATAPKDHRPGHGSSPSLSDELLSSFQGQHALDMSNAQSRIRELEAEVFDAKTNEHTLQKRVAALEDELEQILRQSRAEASGHGPRSMSTTDTRSHTPSSLSQSQSAVYHQRHLRSVRPRVVYEENLSMDIRRKRKISLGMLKARIENERAAAGVLSMTGIGLGMSTGSPLSRVSSIVEIDETVPETAETKGGEGNGVHLRRGSQTQSAASLSSITKTKPTPRYQLKGWDESHIFWCHACKGDLVVL